MEESWDDLGNYKGCSQLQFPPPPWTYPLKKPPERLMPFLGIIIVCLENIGEYSYSFQHSGCLHVYIIDLYLATEV